MQKGRAGTPPPNCSIMPWISIAQRHIHSGQGSYYDRQAGACCCAGRGLRQRTYVARHWCMRNFTIKTPITVTDEPLTIAARINPAGCRQQLALYPLRQGARAMIVIAVPLVRMAAMFAMRFMGAVTIIGVIARYLVVIACFLDRCTDDRDGGDTAKDFQKIVIVSARRCCGQSGDRDGCGQNCRYRICGTSLVFLSGIIGLCRSGGWGVCSMIQECGFAPRDRQYRHSVI